MAKVWILVTIIAFIWPNTGLVKSNSATATSSSSSSPPSSPSSSSGQSNAAAKDEIIPPPESDSTSVNKQLPEYLSDMGTLSSGVYSEYLPQPIFYESAVPLILQYQTPQWNKTEITFNNWYTCLTETAPYRYSCPVTFHMNKAIVNLHVDFEGLHPIADTRTQGLQESAKYYYERLTGHSEFCDKIQKHFAGIWTEASDFQSYLQALRSCSQGSDAHPYTTGPLNDYSYSIRQPFTKMENNFYNTFYKYILGSGTKTNQSASLDLVASALLSNTRTSLQGVILGQYYAEKNRWIHANEDCRQGYIPTSLVSPDMLNQSLSEILKMRSFEHDQELSISPAQMSKYYSLPLTDCTHTTDAFVVRVLIPMLKKFRGQSLQLVHVHTVPFQYQDHICRVKLPENKNMQNSLNGDGDSSSMYLFHALTKKAYRTTCKPNELCKIYEYMFDIRKSDPCVSALLSRNDLGIRTHCDFECRPKDDYVIPTVARISANQFVVTGSPLSLTVSCGRITPKETLIQVKPGQVGAMLIKLSCHCKMIFPHFNTYFGGHLCEPEKDILGDSSPQPELNYGNDVTTTPIIPFMFAKSKPKHVQPEYQEKTANSVNHFNDDGDFGEGHLFNLTEMIDPGRINSYIRASQARRQSEEKSYKGMDYYAEKLQSASENGNSGLGGLFWTVFIVSLIVILSLQIYIIVMFKRYDRVSYIKDDRILYRVEPDTASLN